MSLKADGKVTPSNSQLLVEDPEAFIKQLKKRVAEKQGIPESQQRLIFSVPSFESGEPAVAASEQAAEEFVGHLQSWQAILFRNEKAVGQLLAPHVSSTEVPGGPHTSGDSRSSGEVVVDVICIEYDRWRPSWVKKGADSRQLYLPVDGEFEGSTYRIQVIGQSKGRSFAVPVTYQFSGKAQVAALGVQVQRAEYVRRHQIARGEVAEGSKHLRSIAIDIGKGLGGFTTVYDAEDEPAWLKSVALRFAVVASHREADVARPPGPSQQPMSDSNASQIADKAREKELAKQEQIARDWLPKGGIGLGTPRASSKVPKAKKGKKGGQVGRRGAESSTPAENFGQQSSLRNPAPSASDNAGTGPGRDWNSYSEEDWNAVTVASVPSEPPKAPQQQEPGSRGGLQPPIVEGSKPSSTEPLNPSPGRQPKPNTGQAVPAVASGQRGGNATVQAGRGSHAPNHGTGEAEGARGRQPAEEVPASAQLPKKAGGQDAGKPAKGRQKTQPGEPSQSLRRPLPGTRREGEAQNPGDRAPSEAPAGRARQPGATARPAMPRPQPSRPSEDLGPAGLGVFDPLELGKLRVAPSPADVPRLPRELAASGRYVPPQQVQSSALGVDPVALRRVVSSASREDPPRLREDNEGGKARASQDEASSDGSLQTACSDLGPDSPSMSVEPLGIEALPPLLHTHSNAHSSAGASFRTYASADSFGSRKGEEEELPPDVPREPPQTPAQPTQPPVAAQPRSAPASEQGPIAADTGRPSLSRGRGQVPPQAAAPTPTPPAAVQPSFTPAVEAAAASSRSSSSSQAAQPSPDAWPIKPSKISYPPKLSTELQRRNFGVDRMTLVGSPISPKDPTPLMPSGVATSSGGPPPAAWGASNLRRTTSARPASSGGSEKSEEQQPAAPLPFSATNGFVVHAAPPSRLPADERSAAAKEGVASLHGPGAETPPATEPTAQGVPGGPPPPPHMQRHPPPGYWTPTWGLAPAAATSPELATARPLAGAASVDPNPSAFRGHTIPNGFAAEIGDQRVASPGDSDPRQRMAPDGSHPNPASSPLSPSKGVPGPRQGDPRQPSPSAGYPLPPQEHPLARFSRQEGFAAGFPLPPEGSRGGDPRPKGPLGSKSRSHDPTTDAITPAMLAELAMIQGNAFGGGRSQRTGFMTPPPPPPPRTPPPDTGGGGIERQGSFQVPQPAQSSVFDSHGQPGCDLERLMSCVTPVLSMGEDYAVGNEDKLALRMSDVWKFFEEASSFGREVYTRSGRRGPALAYYTPFLSAIRALLPATCNTRQGGEMPVQPLVHHFETEPPFNRAPLFEAVSLLTPEADPDRPDQDWGDVRLVDLHPASWFAVAWYPIYRIPDSPLTAKFLTYHSFQPTPASRTYFGAGEQQAVGVGRGSTGDWSDAANSPLCLPILGLKMAEQRGEPWVDPYSHSREAAAEWGKRLQKLQAKAESLSAGKLLRVMNKQGEWKQPHSSHSDLDWFNRNP